jgi:hypothetical protein
MYNKFHNNGPIGERDYEDAGSVSSTPCLIQQEIAKKEAAIKATAVDRFALRAKLENEFFVKNNRRPLRSELNSILAIVNKTVGI